MHGRAGLGNKARTEAPGVRVAGACFGVLRVARFDQPSPRVAAHIQLARTSPSLYLQLPVCSCQPLRSHPSSSTHQHIHCLQAPANHSTMIHAKSCGVQLPARRAVPAGACGARRAGHLDHGPVHSQPRPSCSADVWRVGASRRCTCAGPPSRASGGARAGETLRTCGLSAPA
jgi:hypothetical protein